MDRILQAQENALLSFQENIQPMRASGLLLHFKGTAAAATTAALSDLGNIVIKRKGETIINRPAEVFALMGDINQGSNYFSSTEAGTFEATVFIPFYEKSLMQAMNITGPSELNFDYQPKPGGLAAFADLQLSVYAEQSFKREEYQYYILGDDQTPGAAVTSRPYQLNRENITAVYLRDLDSVLTSAAFRQNGEQRFSDQPFNVLLAGTLYDNMLETSTFGMVQLQAFTFGEPASTLNAKSILELTTSATGTIEVTHTSIRWPNN